MGQSTLLDNQVQDRKSFVVSVERTIRLAEFESLRLALSERFPGNIDKDQAYQSVLGKIQEWTSAAKPAARGQQEPETQVFTAVNKPKESPTVSDNHALSPSPSVSKPAALTIETLRERLAKWLPDLEIMDGFDGFIVKPRRYLGDAWKEVNDVVRSLGGHWIRGSKPADGVWRISK